MADTTTPAESPATEAVLGAIVELLKTGSNPDLIEAQRILLQRTALEGDVVPSRIPAPKNVTEVGGYLNLLSDAGQSELRGQMLASILGVAGPNPPLGWMEGTALAFVNVPNDRPEGPAQPAIPVSLGVRSDFLDAFDAARKLVHDAGCALPLLAPARTLPRAYPGAPVPPEDLLPFLGRSLEVVPSALLRNPDQDPLAIARLETDAPDAFQLVARELDGGAATPERNWSAQKCDGASCTALVPLPHRFFPLAPALAAGGWYPVAPKVLPSTLTQPGSLTRFVNLTGLVAGVTRLGDELTLLYPSGQVSASTLVTRLNWVWDGTAFKAPTA